MLLLGCQRIFSLVQVSLQSLWYYVRRENQDVLVIDASEYFVKANKNNKLQASDIRRIVDAYRKKRYDSWILYSRISR